MDYKDVSVIIVSLGALMLYGSNFFKIKSCEKDLPRTQQCVIKAVVEPVKKGF